MNPYVVLGLKKTATAEAVKRAFRRAAKKAHPDCGGTLERFQEVKLAYAVLSDPARRARYDATGEVVADKPDNSLAPVLGTVSQALQAVVAQMTEQGHNLAQHKLNRLMDEWLRKNRENVATVRQKLGKARASLRTAAGRFTVKDGENHLEAMLAAHIKEIDNLLKVQEAEDARFKAAQEFLKAYDYRAGVARPVTATTNGWFTGASFS